ncbi:DNA repair protein XRCC1 isoform X2 [Drosophila takahashii]|uniref:DNA repair protein XRCC1 isoform X2 n=1 Tax=Drosophila takahashii TaxID=29030 RepID=UPI0038990186
MPIAVFKSVREVHGAANLLKESAGRKWRIRSPGEKSAYVILEFEDPQQITGIDIGNEHAAFVEVLVSRTGCQADDFRELLLSSSFMTPIESKNSSNPNRVRCFSGSALAESVLPEKWKLLKIVCTQPFNRHVQYGLSFVKVHVMATPAAAPPKVKSLLPQGIMQFGAFKLREESPDSETDNQVNRFQRWKKETTAIQSTAAAIRDAGSTALRRLSTGKVAVSSLAASPAPSPVSGSPAPSDAKPLDRNRASLLFGDDDDDENEAADEGNAKKQRLSKHLEADKDRRRLEQEKERESKKNKSSRHSLDKSTSREEKSSAKEHRSSSKEERSKERSHSKEEKSVRTGDKCTSKHPDSSKAKESPRPSAQKRHSSPTAGAAAATPAKKQKVKDTPIQYRPFNQLLKGVLLVISGIQNPDRADLRSKAIALGAKYKADWEPGCTHLICAFKNTPKYNQVRGKGKIVTRSWIEKCYSLKKYLPWRRYALDTNDFGQPESDEEVCDEAMKPSSRRESSEDDVEMLQDNRVKTTYDAEVPEDRKKVDIRQDASSGIDTEDELERVKQENNARKTKPKTPTKTKSSDVYDASTDEEEYLVLKKKQITSVD